MASRLINRYRLRFLLCAALACRTCPAWSQAAIGGIDPFTPPAAAGAPTEFNPDAALIARGHAVAASGELTVGSTVIRPQFSESFGLDSNVSAASTPHGSIVEQTDASIAAGSTTLAAQANVLDVVSKAPGGLNTTTLSAYLPFTIDDARLRYRIELSRFSINPALEVTSYNFSNGNAGGVPIVESDQNRLSYNLSVSVHYFLSTGRSLVLTGDITNAQYGAQSSGAPRPDYLDDIILAGIDYDTDAVIRYRPITEVACWAHTRCGFFDEWEHHQSPTAKQALDRIAAIYAIEARAAFAPLAERVVLRREAAPLLDAFFDWADVTVTKLSAKSTLAEAFRYAINRRQALSRFISDGRLEIDDNIAENAMRCIAVGRRNYLFVGSDAGGDRAASIYTLVQTAKLNSANPEAYLRDTLARIAEGHPINRVDDLMPWKTATLG